MRAWDLAVFIIFAEMMIGFISILGDDPNGPNHGGGLFSANNYSGQYFAANPGGYVYDYQHTNATNTTGDKLSVDYLTFAIDWIFASFNVLFRIVEAFVAISWVLYSQFHLEPRFCLFLQGIVYFIYTWAFIQWRSGRGGKAFE
jgi:hypothetical protein